MPIKVRKIEILGQSEEQEKNNEKKKGKEAEKDEEKPVEEPTSLSSEETHGGEESTQSIKNSPNTSENGQQESGLEQNSEAQQSSESEAQQQSQSPNVLETGTGVGTGIKNQGMSSNNSQSESEQANTGQSGTTGSENKEENNNESEENEGEEENENENNSEEGMSQHGGENESEEGEENENNTPKESEESNAEKNKEENEELQEELNEYSEAEQQDKVGHKNAIEFEFNSEKARKNMRLQRVLYNFIEAIADETKIPNPQGNPDRYDAKRLMLRSYEGKPLNWAKTDKVRESIVILVDNSGSMRWVLDEIGDFLRTALERKDVEAYTVPNGELEGRITKKLGVELLSDDEKSNILKRIINERKKVIYIGDYDGADTPIELSKYTMVYWIAPETRYIYPEDHDWVHYTIDDFKGFYYRILKPEELIDAISTFLKNAYRQGRLLKNFYVKLYNDEESDNEEENYLDS